MRGCFKAIRWRRFCLGAILWLPLSATAAVLIEEGPPVRDDGGVESDVRAESEWNRTGDLPVEVPVPREPASDASPEIDERDVLAPKNIDEAGEPPAPRQSRRRRERRSPQIGRSDTRLDQGYADIGELRRTRRVGVGASFLGRAGFIGLDTELNLAAEHSALASIGGGPGYTGVSLGYKWTPFTSRWHPSFGGAVAGWVSESENFRNGATVPAFFRPRSGQEGESRLRAVYVIPSVGLQSLQTRGPGVGGMIFAEALFFVDVSTLAVQPLGSVGARYFF